MGILPNVWYNINNMIGQQPGETREEFIARQKRLAVLGGTARKGKKNKSTIDREKQLEDFKNFTAGRTKTLWSIQMMRAMGSIKVFRIDTETIGEGKNEKKIRKRPVLVTDTEEIIDALDYEYAQGEDPNTEDAYYFVSAQDPSDKAIDSLLDRTFGKAKESMAVEHSGAIGLADLLGRSALDKIEEK